MKNNEIDELSNAVLEMYDLKDAYKFIDKKCETNKDFQELDLNLFKYKDYYIKTGKAFNFDRYLKSLEKINGLDIKSAPVLVQSSILKNNQDVVLITQIPDSENDELIKFNKIKKDIPVSAKQNLVNDFDKLLQEGIYNPAITDSTNNWMVVPKTKGIYIDDWSVLKEFKNEHEKTSLRKLLKEMCGLIY